MDKVEVYYPASLKQWRRWLEENHLSSQSVWLVMYKKDSDKNSITWSEAVDVALCFGWIDSKKVKIDHEKSHQFFSKRKPKSTWSKINKDKVQRLIDAGQMTPSGYECIEIAKKNGWWTILDSVEKLIVPEDLEEALTKYKGSKEFFLSLSKTDKKLMLKWVVLARRPETRQRRIDQIATYAGQNKKPNQF